MFCKWCGNTINPKDTHCTSCGREIPPLADCGGFYDLKHSAQVVESSADAVPAPGPAPVVQNVPDGKSAKDRKAARRHYRTSLAFFMILLLLSAAAVGLLVWQSMALNRMNENIEMYQEAAETEPEETQVSTEPIETEPETEPAATEAPKETESPAAQPRSGEITVSFTDAGATVRTDMGEYGAVSSVFTGTDPEKNAVRVVTLELENAASVLTIRISENEEMLVMTPLISEEVFGKAAGCTHEWNYRLSPDAEWEMTGDDAFRPVNDGAGSILQSSREILEGLTSGYGEEVELQWILTRRSENGDELRIVVEGVSFGSQ